MKLMLGTVQFGQNYGVSNRLGVTPVNEVSKIISFARSEGIDAIDTASAYGESQTVLGRIGVKDFLISTKIPSMRNQDISIREIVETSLDRLKLNKVHTVLFHDAKDLAGSVGIAAYDQLNDLKEQGLVSKIGVSTYSPQEAIELTERFAMDVIQIPCNVLDQRLMEEGVLTQLSGVELHIRSAFLQGLLLMPIGEIPEYFSPIKQKLIKYHELIQSCSLSPLEGALGFIRSQNNFEKLVVGVNSLAQLREIVDAYRMDNECPNISQFAETDLDFINPSRWTIE